MSIWDLHETKQKIKSAERSIKRINELLTDSPNNKGLMSCLNIKVAELSRLQCKEKRDEKEGFDVMVESGSHLRIVN